MTFTRQIALFVALIGIVSGVALGFLTLSFEAAERRLQVENNTNRFLSAIIPQISSAYWEVDETRINSLLNSLLEDPLIRTVRIEDPIMTETLRDTTGLMELSASKDLNSPPIWWFERLMGFTDQSLSHSHNLISPRDGSLLGSLVVEIYFDSVRADLTGRSAQVFGVSILQTLFVIIVVFLVVQVRVIRPLARLQVATQKVREGSRFQLDPRDEWHLDQRKRDEISRLARAFQRTMTEVEGHRDTLRDKVAERTLELEEARNRAVEASAAKSAFLANMNHELRTPLNAIIGLSGILIRGQKAGRTRQHLDDLQNAATQLSENIDSVLDLSKIEAGELSIDLEEMTLNNLLDDILTQLRALLAGRPVALRWAFQVDLPHVIMADRIRLRQILTNLASNAAKFTEQGEISFQVSAGTVADKQTIEFSITDTGIGFDMAQVDEIFRPFGQVDGSTTRSYGGTGLGLAIVQGLADQMSASIDVESRVGAGSRFTLSLPVEVIEGRASPQSTTISVDGTGPHLSNLKRMRDRLGYRRGVTTKADVHVTVDPDGVMFAARGRQVELAHPLTFVEFVSAVESIHTDDAPITAQPAKPLAGVVVAIVEDNPVNQKVFAEIVRETGATVLCFETGALVLNAVRDAMPDLILMDLQMPGMDGRQTLAALRHEHGNVSGKRFPPVIVVTADATHETKQLCAALGFAHFLAKPVMPDDLRSLVCRFAGATDTALLDREAGLAYADGNPKLYLAALQQVSERLDTWRHELAGPNGQSSAVLHDLKGMAATIGAKSLAVSARDAEHSGNLDDVLSGLALLARELGANPDPGARETYQSDG